MRGSFAGTVVGATVVGGGVAVVLGALGGGIVGAAVVGAASTTRDAAMPSREGLQRFAALARGKEDEPRGERADHGARQSRVHHGSTFDRDVRVLERSRSGQGPR